MPTMMKAAGCGPSGAHRRKMPSAPPPQPPNHHRRAEHAAGAAAADGQARGEDLAERHGQEHQGQPVGRLLGFRYRPFWRMP
jgi:hypothetical protein